jgi:ATP-dependent RNA helicase DeaD
VLIVPYSARRRTERLLREAGIQARWGEPPSADDIKRRDDQRLLADPILQAAPERGEKAIVTALLEQHDPAHIAAAFVRLYRKGQAAPEDLVAAPDWTPAQERPERAPRQARADNFEGGVWVTLSVGRSKSAEPRWLIPMLCKAGGITKRQIGSIRIEQTETHVEIDAASIDGFMAHIGEGGRLEKSIHVKRLDRAPPPQTERRERRPPPPAHSERPKPRANQPPPQRAHNAKPPAKPHRKHADAKRPGDAPPKRNKWHPLD